MVLLCYLLEIGSIHRPHDPHKVKSQLTTPHVIQVRHIENVSDCNGIWPKAVICATGAEFVVQLKIELLRIIESWPIS